MQHLIRGCTPTRVLASLASMVGHACSKDARVRAVVARSLREALERHHRDSGGESLEAAGMRPDALASVKRAVVKLATDAAQDSRQHGLGAVWVRGCARGWGGGCNA